MCSGTNSGKQAERLAKKCIAVQSQINTSVMNANYRSREYCLRLANDIVMSFICFPGTLANDTIRRIRDIETGGIDDVIRVHEELCEVVSDTVKMFSPWFVLHWLVYCVTNVMALIFISEEVQSRVEYEIPDIVFVYYGLLFASHIYLFIFPCSCAAHITSTCGGKFGKSELYLNSEFYQ